MMKPDELLGYVDGLEKELDALLAEAEKKGKELTGLAAELAESGKKEYLESVSREISAYRDQELRKYREQANKIVDDYRKMAEELRNSYDAKREKLVQAVYELMLRKLEGK